MNKRALVSGCFLLMPVFFLCAQETTGKIIGILMEDYNYTPIFPGMMVRATIPGKGGEATTQTDEKGVFRLCGLYPGIYRIEFFHPNYTWASLTIENVRVHAGQTIDLKKPVFPLRRFLDERIFKNGGDKTIDTRSSLWARSLDKETFRFLPRGRNFDSLASLAPGVMDEKLLAGTSVDGASGLENRYFIDGMDTTSLLTGAAGQAVAFDFVDEVQVTSSGFQAEFAGALGGVINVVTRSGGNEFHGEIMAYYTGATLRGKYRDSLGLDFTDTSKATYYSYEFLNGRDRDFRIEAGFNLGGYILKDKLWFFGSFLPVYYRNTRTLTHSNANTVKDWKRTEQTWNFQVKLTSQPLKNLRLSASLVNNLFKYKGDLATRSSDPNPRVSHDDTGFSYPNMSGIISVDWAVTDHFLVNLHGGLFRTNRNGQLVQPPDEPCYRFLTEFPGGYFPTTNRNLPGIPEQYKQDAGWVNYNPADANVVKKQIDVRYSVNADITCFLNLAGEHSWKAGVQFVRQGEDYDVSPKHPIIFLAWDRDFKAFGVNYGRGTYGYYAVRNNELTGPYGTFYKAFSNRWALYLQDSWTIANRLTINAGVRTESEYVPSYATGNPDFENLRPIEFGFQDKISQRFGFAWDVKGDCSLKIFGSFGIFYDLFKLKTAADFFGGWKWKTAYYSLDTYEWDKIGKNGYFPGRLLYPQQTIDFRPPAFDELDIDPALKPMSSREFSLGLEKKLLADVSLSLRLVQKHLRYSVENMGTLWAGGNYILVNPGYGWSLQIKNGGKFPDSYWECPKAKREYWGFNLAVDKRFANNWLAGFSYTWSRLTGNYSGLAQSDEEGHFLLEASHYYDFWYLAFDLKGNPLDGVLPTDRPHVFKTFAAYVFPFSLNVGLILQAMSGTPVSEEWIMDVPGYLPYNRSSLGRTPWLWFANAYAEYNLKIGRNMLSINLNIENLFNTHTATRIYQIYNMGGIGVPDKTILAKDWDINDYYPVLDPRYKKPLDFYGPINARLGLRFQF